MKYSTPLLITFREDVIYSEEETSLPPQESTCSPKPSQLFTFKNLLKAKFVTFTDLLFFISSS